MFQSLSSPPAQGTLGTPVTGLSGSAGVLLTRLRTVEGPGTGREDGPATGRRATGERGGEGYGDQYPCSFTGRTAPNAETAGEGPPASRSHLLDPTIIDTWL